MVPVSIINIIFKLQNNFHSIQKDVLRYKYDFCIEFEEEMSFEQSEYANSVFDYIFNLFTYKKVFKGKDFENSLDEFKGLNFINSAQNCRYFSQKYLQFVTKYRDYFMDHFGFTHQDDMYIARKVDNNREEIREKLITLY